MADNIEQLLKIAQDESASDLHLNVNRPPIIRVDGKLLRLDDHPTLQTEDVQVILDRIAKPEQVRKFLEHYELDFSYDNQQIGRFRVSACMQKGSISLAFRLLHEARLSASPIAAAKSPPAYSKTYATQRLQLGPKMSPST